ncbi:MAG: sensor histidine kinase [Candidatus Abyssobacteria bacterium SURF_5]|uniref:histidine kinase n=1 Tax=Abyssobacteria bacterium (strain SURF_5) TaxID=2093360 RepID=A0A3A4P3C5_ABYX5|nr:MAG: sensor histidine kinase [Candidatus Abyssubacteria bacterium SURF_5]
MRQADVFSGMTRQTLTRRFVTIMAVGAGFAILCSALFSYYHGYKIRSEGAGVAVQRVAEGRASEIHTALSAGLSLLVSLSQSDRLQEAVSDQSQRYRSLSAPEIADLAIKEMALWKVSSRPQAELQALQNNELAAALQAVAIAYPGFRLLRVIDQAGIVIAAYGELHGPSVIQEEWWQQTEAFERDRPRLYEPLFTEEPASVVVPMTVPIFPSATGSAQWILYAEYSLDHMLIHEKSQEITALLIGAGNERNLWVFKNDSQTPRMVRITSGLQKFDFGEIGQSLVPLDQLGITAFAGFAPVLRPSSSPPLFTYDGSDWSAVVAIPEDIVMRPLNSLFFQALIFSAIVLVSLSLSGLAMARRALKPIRVLQLGVQEIGQGNLEHRIDIRSGDEIELLAVEFNRMADRMQRAQEQLQRHSKELEQKVNQLRRLQAQLMQSERMAATGELAAQIAHEINNPLGIIKNYVGIAKLLMPEEDPNRENMKIVDQEINRIAGIVRRLLRFAKPGAEDIQSVQINQVLEELLALLRGQLFRRKIEVTSELAENLPEVNVSTDQIRQVFLNLIKNAEDAMPEGGKMTVRTRYRKGRVEIDVADDGCGIPPENIKNIFEPFFTTKGVKGTGLGLSVSYGIIKNYNGEISVDSEPGRGTTFTIQLPVVSDKVFQVIQSS